MAFVGEAEKMNFMSRPDAGGYPDWYLKEELERANGKKLQPFDDIINILKEQIKMLLDSPSIDFVTIEQIKARVNVLQSFLIIKNEQPKL